MHRISIQSGLLFVTLLLNFGCFAQHKNNQLGQTAFKEADIKWNQNAGVPVDIKPHSTSSLTEEKFFDTYKNAFDLSPENTFKAHQSNQDQAGQTHSRYKQYYKGLEVAEVQYILHTKEGKVYHAHGNLVHELNIDTSPTLGEQQAQKLAHKHIGDKARVMSPVEYKKSNLSSMDVKPAAKSKLMIAAGPQSTNPDDYRLVYRFDVITSQPLGRYDVYIDAHTGELVNKIPKIYDKNIQAKGLSLYNDTVDITISDDTFQEDWELPSEWHINDWEAYGGSGMSWWLADTLLGTNGGYTNEWYDVLQTHSFILEGTNPVLEFYHRYAVEPPEDYEDYDGWDGMNVRISTDGGMNWEILTNPDPAYTSSSLYSFGHQHNEGVDIPGWAGIQEEWEQVSFDLGDFAGDTVLIRFAFASDPAYSTADADPDLFGWQIDNINVSSTEGTLFSNNGTDDNMEIHNLFQFAQIIEGAYRLRETERGKGIATFNALNDRVINQSVDFVENDSIFVQQENRAGVSLHWAAAKTYDYFLEKHDRLSYDDQDSRILVYANWVFETENGTTPNNAQWLGSAGIFGAGDGTLYDSWGTLDITGHEIAHGVTEYSAGLIYQNEPGALNESFSDIFGAAVEFYAEEAQGDWLIGEDNVIQGSVIRSMQNPNELGAPDTYRGNFWVNTTSNPSNQNDYGGVHTNSGVQNYWFYLLSEGGSGTNDDGVQYDVTGIGLDKAEKIAYRNLTAYLTPRSDYTDAAVYSRQSAIDLYGEESEEANSVIKAWEAVGIYFNPSLFTQSTYSFEMVVNQVINRLINLENKGTETLTITNIEIAGDAFSLSSLPSFPVNIDRNDPLSVQISFYPTALETYEGTLTIHSNDPGAPVKEITLHGEGVSETVPISYNEQDPEVLALLDAYPNPFDAQTRICFSVPKQQRIDIKIVNTSGRIVKTLANREFVPGVHELTWNGTGETGHPLAPGNYIIWMQAGKKRFVQAVLKQ